MLVDACANYQIEFTDVKILLFVLLVILFKCKQHWQVDDISQCLCEFFCVLIIFFILIYHSSLFFFIFHQVVGKPFGFINHVLQKNENFLTESNFPSSLSLSLYIHSGPSLGKMSKQFLYKYRYQRIQNIFSCLDKNDKGLIYWYRDSDNVK